MRSREQAIAAFREGDEMMGDGEQAVQSDPKAGSQTPFKDRHSPLPNLYSIVVRVR